MIFLLKRAFIYSAVWLFIYSCNTTSRRTITEMEFNVDSSIVNKPEQDTALKIRYAVPASWHTDSSAEAALKQVQTGSFRISKILKNPAGTVVFSLSDVRQVPDSVFESMNENYKTVLNPAGSWNNVEHAEFITKEFQVNQFVMSKQGQTFFKMLFGDRKRPLFQVDYSVMIDSAYALNTKTLESIIGSLHRDH